jgi:hypothetical protein
MGFSRNPCLVLFFFSEADITHHATWDEGLSPDSSTASSDTGGDASTKHAGEWV